MASTTRRLGATLGLCSLLMMSFGPVGAVLGPGGTTLPFEATGLMGALDTTTLSLDGRSAHEVVFDTSTGLYSLDGVAMNDETTRRLIELRPATDERPASALWVFDFESIKLGPSTTVTAIGSDVLIILSKGEASLGASFLLDGAPGLDAGKGAGGGGGGGGGAIAVFATRALSFTGTVSVDGGPGGAGNVYPENPLGGSRKSGTQYRGGDGGAGAVTLGSAERVLFDGSIRALVGGRHEPSVSSVALVGPVAFGPSATVNGDFVTAATSALSLLPGVAPQTFFISAGAGGGGAGGSGLPRDMSGKDVRDGYADVAGAGGLGGVGGGAGGAGAYAVAGGAGGAGGGGGATASPPFTQVDGGGSGGGGGGGGAYNGPGGTGGAGGSKGSGVAARPGLPGLNGVPGGNGNCALGAQNGGNGGGGGPATFPSNAGGNGGTGGVGTAGGAGGDGLDGQNGNIVPSGSASSNGGGGGGGGGASGGDGGKGGNGGNGHPSFGDGGGGGGGGGGGADTCLPGVIPEGSGAGGGNGGSGTNGGRTGSVGRNSGDSAPAGACNDGNDNDQDGLWDYPNDPGCTDASDQDECNVRTKTRHAYTRTFNSGWGTKVDILLTWSLADSACGTPFEIVSATHFCEALSGWQTTNCPTPIPKTVGSVTGREVTATFTCTSSSCSGPPSPHTLRVTAYPDNDQGNLCSHSWSSYPGDNNSEWHCEEH